MTSCPAAPSPSSSSSLDQDGTAMTSGWSSSGASTPTRASSGEPEASSLGWARAASRRRRTDARGSSAARTRSEGTSRIVRDADADTTRDVRIGATPLDVRLGASAVVVVFPKRRTCRWRALKTSARAPRNSRPTPATRARTNMIRREVVETRRAWSPRASIWRFAHPVVRIVVRDTRAEVQLSIQQRPIRSAVDFMFPCVRPSVDFQWVRRVTPHVTSLPSRFPCPR